MAKRFLAIGECIVELVSAGDGVFSQGFSGDTLDAALHARQGLGTGWRVGPLTAIGDDDWSARLFAFMKAAGLETNHVRRLNGRQPAISLVTDENGERSTEIWRRNSAALDLADDHDVLEAAINGTNAILFSAVTLSILAPDARGQLLAAIERAKARGATVAFDSAFGQEAWTDTGTIRAATRAAARASTIAFATVADEAPLFGEKEAAAVAKRYATDGCGEAVLFDGSNGALVVWPSGQITAALPPAGRSAFRNAYLTERLKGSDPEAAAGSAAAG
jgi:2-dehydro-3-deoxygluconokinase